MKDENHFPFKLSPDDKKKKITAKGFLFWEFKINSVYFIFISC